LADLLDFRVGLGRLVTGREPGGVVVVGIDVQIVACAVVMVVEIVSGVEGVVVGIVVGVVVVVVVIEGAVEVDVVVVVVVIVDVIVIVFAIATAVSGDLGSVGGRRSEEGGGARRVGCDEVTRSVSCRKVAIAVRAVKSSEVFVIVVARLEGEDKCVCALRVSRKGAEPAPNPDAKHEGGVDPVFWIVVFVFAQSRLTS
jgi:hypothetical protein